MWRATMMALGLALCLLGGEALVVDRVVMADASSDLASRDAFAQSGMSSPYSAYDGLSTYGAGVTGMDRRVFVPPEWAPWGFLSAGALTFLYATALPSSKGE